jgi:hypothetical protein
MSVQVWTRRGGLRRTSSPQQGGMVSAGGRRPPSTRSACVVGADHARRMPPAALFAAVAAAAVLGAAAAPTSGAAMNGTLTFVSDASAQCLDGSPYAFYLRAGDPTKWVLHFDGGGWVSAAVQPCVRVGVCVCLCAWLPGENAGRARPSDCHLTGRGVWWPRCQGSQAAR